MVMIKNRINYKNKNIVKEAWDEVFSLKSLATDVLAISIVMIWAIYIVPAILNR